MAAKGIMPSQARPAANVTACCTHRHGSPAGSCFSTGRWAFFFFFFFFFFGRGGKSNPVLLQQTADPPRASLCHARSGGLS